MGDEEPRREKDYDGGDVYRTKLDFYDRHAQWLADFASQKSRRKLQFHDEELEAACRQLVQKKRLVLMQGVKLEVGNNVPSHPHDEQDVVLYMPMTHPSALLFRDPDIRFPTEEGTAIYIPAGQWHEVEKNESGKVRYTIAVLYR